MRTTAIAALAAGALASGAAAATILGTSRSELLVGTPKRDLVVAGGGNDRVAVQHDRVRDTVRCGRGRDVVTADRIDAVARDCEIVSRLISRDTYKTPDGQHETQVEPHSLAAGSTIVATFQSGRRHAGGAADIGFSTSRDGGRTWQGGHLPALTVNSRPAGTAAYASDPVVAYDAGRGVWLISTLAVSPGLTELYISRSTDGLRWSAPVVAARFSSGSLAFDKNWAACDSWPQSPYFGRCYLAYTVHITRTPRMDVQFSDDGGLTWSEPVVAVRAAEAVGVLPLPRPDGSLVVPYLGADEMQSIRS
ncbi:MAG: sialidase family protein, partial [Gaiellaceae bacterium]